MQKSPDVECHDNSSSAEEGVAGRSTSREQVILWRNIGSVGHNRSLDWSHSPPWHTHEHRSTVSNKFQETI